MLFLNKNLNLSRHCSTLASKTLNPSSSRFNPIADYLISSCGLPSQKAASACKQIPKFTSIDQAHSVRHFLEHLGFAEPRICNAVSGFPKILSADVDRTLQPNLEVLRGLGFSEPELQLVVETHPRVLINPFAVPGLQFWRNFLGSSRSRDRGSSAGFLMERRIDIVSGIAPKIAMLKENRYSEIEIIHIVKRACSFVALMPMGQGLVSLSRIEWDAFDAKMEFFKEFGWSEVQFLAALVEDAHFIHLPEENVRETMKFLVDRAGCDWSYIVHHPSLLTFNLEERLRPRCHVMEMLKSKQLLTEKRDLLSIMKMSEKNFVSRFIEMLPQKLRDNYIGTSAS